MQFSKSFSNKKDLTPRVYRWWAFLQSFDFDLIYREGKRMKHADYLSRNPTPPLEKVDVNTNIRSVRVIDLYTDWLSVEQKRDNDLLNTITKLKTNELDPDLAKTYDIRNDLLYRKIERRHKSLYLPVVPKSMAWSIINHVHTDLKHLSWEKTLDKIYELYWFPKMARTVRKFVENCLVCKSSKNTSGAKQVQMHAIPKIPKPWHTIHVDISGKLSGKSDTKEYVFVIIDAFSKFVLLRKIKSLTSGTAVDCLKETTYLFGAPAQIVCDQGKCFTSSEFRGFCKSHNIDLHVIAHSTSRANGQVERVMQTLKNILTSVESEGTERWQDSLGEVQLALNSTRHRVTGFSPAELLFGTEIRSLNLQKIVHSELLNCDNVMSLKDIRDQADRNIKVSAQKDTSRFNLGKATIRPFKEGDFVFSKSNERMLTKLERKYRGPFKVVKVLANDRYEVERVSRKGKGQLFKFAHDQLQKVPEGQGEIVLDPDAESLTEPVSADN